jgi:hypothetical protein
MDAKEFDHKHPWKLLGAAGAAIAVASAATVFMPGFLIGLALLAYGAGDWISRPTHTEITTAQRPGEYIIHRTNPWKRKPMGLVFYVIAVVLFILGLFAVFKILVPSAP